MKRVLLFVAVCAGTLGCPQPKDPAVWQVVASGLDEALMGVAGSSERDVWAVGADVGAGKGPLVLHFDGTAWSRLDPGTKGHLWWVHAFSDGTALFGGVRSTIVQWNGSAFVRQATPGLARQTVFGIWGSAPNDAYAVGSGTSGRRGFIWHFDGTSWAEVPMPADVPVHDGETPGLFKVWGTGANDVWAVGADGLVLHKTDSWQRVAISRTDTLFTVSGRKGQVLISGGGRTSVLLEGDGDTFADVSPSSVSLVQGVATDPSDATLAYAVGDQGAVFSRTGSGWSKVDTQLALSVESLHAVWVDPKGGAWAVGGKVLTNLTSGALVRLAPKNAAVYVQPEKPIPPAVVCPATQIDPAEGQSIARRWDEQVLGAIRRDLPRPTVHARTLYHFSAAMWDAWAAYTTTALGVYSHERATAADVEAARAEAISYAAYRMLEHRYLHANGGPVSDACFRAFMTKLGYSPDDTVTTGDSPRALGNRIAQTIIDATANDGANEANNYADTTSFMAANSPLSVESPGSPATDINHWQPLDLAIAATQNGIPLAAGVQAYVGAQWGQVKPFALTRTTGTPTYLDPGPAPELNAASMPSVVEVLRRSSQLGVNLVETIDISPGAYGNNPLGSNAGTGHSMNPVTGQPYAPQVVPLADFGRVMAETWADGPKSETPPGHWNVIANQVFAHASFVRKWKGVGPELPKLEWDVRAYLALNGALHDAAIAAWEIKRVYTCSRPITLIRSSGAVGQSSDAAQPGFNPKGLPLVPGLIELVSAESAAKGGRHEGLQNAVGQVVVQVWKGEPGDTHTVSGTGWLRAVEWVPYQKRDFVTPAFPGFISGHSTFSRAGAEVLTLATGSSYFPGGLGELAVAANTSLTFEAGPTVPVKLQWATYYDAADQAGQSRIWGGIHIEADDFSGRRVGSQVGLKAFAQAETFFQ